MNKRNGSRDSTVANAFVFVLALFVLAWIALSDARAVPVQQVAWCNVDAPDREFKLCIARQASAALEMRGEYVQVNNRLAEVERRSIAAGVSRDEAWKLANDAAYATLRKYGLLK